jgi:hypothetical protein
MLQGFVSIWCELCNYKYRYRAHYRLPLMMNRNIRNMSDKIISFVFYSDGNLD